MTNKEKTFQLTKEMIHNNHLKGLNEEKIKGLKDINKSFDERNQVIMGELKVHTEEDPDTEAPPEY